MLQDRAEAVLNGFSALPFLYVKKVHRHLAKSGGQLLPQQLVPGSALVIDQIGRRQRQQRQFRAAIRQLLHLIGLKALF